MSNASGPSDSMPPDKSPAPPRGTTDGTELDLWELDSDAGNVSQSSDPTKNADPAVFPTRMEEERPILSTTSPERQIDPLEQPSEREKAMMGADPAEASVQETTATPFRNWRSVFRSLSMAEKIAIAALIAILALATTLFILHFSNEIPTKSVLREELALPIEGKFVKVTALETFWREPVLTGQAPEVVRRGTSLIPVVMLQLEAGTAAIRVLFRDGEGTVIGDPINRTIKGKTELRIPATAGFDDIGMHAAYRTGGSLPWTVHILEAKESGLSGDQFHQVLQTEISPDIR